MGMDGETVHQREPLCSSFVQTTYGSLEEGIAGVQNGDIWMAIYIPSGFSSYLAQNISTGFNSFSSTLDPPNNTIIELHADLTGKEVYTSTTYLDTYSNPPSPIFLSSSPSLSLSFFVQFLRSHRFCSIRLSQLKRLVGRSVVKVKGGRDVALACY